MLSGNTITEYSLRNKKHFPLIFESLKTASAVVLAAPLYVDGIPSHVLHFLLEAEQFCKACHFKLYVISNSGFVEGRHSEMHLKQYRCWCERAGVVYGGGLGIGGGVMLHLVFYTVLLLSIAECIIRGMINLFAGGASFFDNNLNSLLWNITIWIIYDIGMLICTAQLAAAVKKHKTAKDRYTRVMVPSFVFLILADAYMVILALLHGTLPFSLFRKDGHE
ncbi:MAG: hypothetical protein LBC31_04645 [Treponema sp.]|jgi:hypothetical protein|nr:hypothetical protein [Treponema sp.]